MRASAIFAVALSITSVYANYGDDPSTDKPKVKHTRGCTSTLEPNSDYSTTPLPDKYTPPDTSSLSPEETTPPNNYTPPGASSLSPQETTPPDNYTPPEQTTSSTTDYPVPDYPPPDSTTSLPSSLSPEDTYPTPSPEDTSSSSPSSQLFAMHKLESRQPTAP